MNSRQFTHAQKFFLSFTASFSWVPPLPFRSETV
jgi:hypothetical protein